MVCVLALHGPPLRVAVAVNPGGLDVVVTENVAGTIPPALGLSINTHSQMGLHWAVVLGST